MLKRLRAALGADGRRAVGNAGFKALSVPIEKACRVAVVVVAAPVLGQSAFGVYQFAATMTALLALGTDVGLGLWTTRALARQRTRAAAIVAIGLRVRAVSGALFALAILSATIWSGPGPLRQALVLFGAAALMNTFIEYFSAIFRGFERLRDEAVLAVVRAILISGAALCVLHFERSLTGLGLGTVLGTLGSLIWGIGILRRRYPSLRSNGARPTLDASLVRQAVTEAGPMWLATLLSLVYFKIDVVILRSFAGDAELGAYSAAFKVFETLTIVPSIVMAAAFSPMARAHGDPARQRRWERWLVALLAALGVAVGGLMYLFSDRIVVFVYGSEFLPGSASLKFLALGVPVMFLNTGLWQFLIARSLEMRNLLLSAVLLVVNVSVNLVLIPRFRGPGAALATGLTEVAHTILALAALRWSSSSDRVR